MNDYIKNISKEISCKWKKVDTVDKTQDMPWSTKSPGLLVFLTDGTPESSLAINRAIDLSIQINYNGMEPHNICFISVIELNNNAKELCSGWLKDLDNNVLHYKTIKKTLPNGVGSIMEVEVKHPIWVEPHPCEFSVNNNSLLLIKELISKWNETNRQFIPIIIDVGCSLLKDSEYLKKEIEELKKSAILLGHSNNQEECFSEHIYDDIPIYYNSYIKKMEITDIKSYRVLSDIIPMIFGHVASL